MFNVGTRFTLYGAEYEITYVLYGELRYTATTGGRSYNTSCDTFNNLRSSGKIKIVFDSEIKLFENSSFPELLRRRRYVEAAIKLLPMPTSKIPLQKLIDKVCDEIKDKHLPGVSTVCKWIRAYQLGADEGLLDRRKKGNGSLRFDPVVEALISQGIDEVYLVKEVRTAADVRAFIVGKLMELGTLNSDESEVRIPSERTINRRIKRLDRYKVIMAKKGRLAAERSMRASGRAFGATTALSMVQIDTHYLDVLVMDPDSGESLGRPYVVCIFCMKTRMVVGLHISLLPPSAISFLGALKYMLLNYGVAAVIIPDNGVEIKNTTFSIVCEKLCTTISQAQVRDPNGKAHLESFFRTLTYGITQKIPGTTFSSPAHRGDYDSEKNAVMTLKQVSSLTEEWISQIYHRTIHTKTGRAPLLAWEDDVKEFPPLKLSADYVDKIARKSYMRTASSGRVIFNHIEYFSHYLSTYNGEKVIVLVDELNLDSVYVCNPSDKSTLIKCESTDPEYTDGLSIYEHEEARKIKEDMKKSDRRRLGKYASLMSRYLLLEKIHQFGKAGRKLKRKLLNGDSSKNSNEQKSFESENKQFSNISDDYHAPIQGSDDSLPPETSYKFSEVDF